MTKKSHAEKEIVQQRRNAVEIGRIQGCTRTLGKAQGYYGLPLRDIVINDSVTGPNTPAMETAWLPTPEELAALQAGAPIILRVVGTGHPPVMIYVGETPDSEAQREPV